jgi:hypothetical protein
MNCRVDYPKPPTHGARPGRAVPHALPTEKSDGVGEDAGAAVLDGPSGGGWSSAQRLNNYQQALASTARRDIAQGVTVCWLDRSARPDGGCP